MARLWSILRDGDATTINVRLFDEVEGNPGLARILLISAMGTGQTVKVIPNDDPWMLAVAVDFIEAFAAGHGLVVHWEDTLTTLDANFFIAGAAA